MVVKETRDMKPQLNDLHCNREEIIAYSCYEDDNVTVISWKPKQLMLTSPYNPNFLSN